jgi:cytochrome oxidase Cu insertion factor (SCO1/SenC/PrrC family)
MSSSARATTDFEGANHSRRRIRVLSILLGIVVAAIFGVVLARATRSSPPTVPSTFAPSLARHVPPAIAALSLVDEHGHRTALAAFKGRVMVLANFLTSCQEECPVSTGAFLEFEQSLRSDGLESKVAIVEVTIDPARDTPARLAAYEKYTGVDWTLLTGTQAQIDAFWNSFGASYDKVADRPTDVTAIDWETGKRYTYDMNHSNNVYILDASGHERFITAGLPSIHKPLPSKLMGLLSPEGVSNLNHPGFGAWSVGDLRAAVGSVLGRSISGS